MVVENFRPGSTLAEVFNYRTLCETYPQLVVLHISAFGESGPLRDEPGYDMIAQAAAGLMSLTGEPDGPPLRAGYAMGDLGAALFGLSGVLSALFERARTGVGQFVTTSLYEAQLALHINWATAMFATGQTPTRMGSAHPSLVPYQAYPAADGHFVVAAGNDELWRRMCAAIGRDDLAADARFTTNQGRVEHREALNGALEATFAAEDVEYWCAALRDAGVPVTPIRTLDEVYASPQTAALGMVGQVAHPQIGPLDQVGFSVSYRGTGPAPRSAPPTLGQHNHELLAELGYDDATIERLTRGTG